MEKPFIVVRLNDVNTNETLLKIVDHIVAITAPAIKK